MKKKIRNEITYLQRKLLEYRKEQESVSFVVRSYCYCCCLVGKDKIIVIVIIQLLLLHSDSVISLIVLFVKL